MKWLLTILFACITIGLIKVADTSWQVGKVQTPRLGFFLSPQKGFWQNAEPVNVSYNLEPIKSNKLRDSVEVYLDNRLVPHVYAKNEQDAWFVQGYLHAKFRLWQMEFQVFAASGRLSEILGEEQGGVNFLKVDRMFHRLGMNYAAENSLAVMEADSVTNMLCDQYTAGINAYIRSLNEADYPLEYKILGYKPEEWTNLKTALLVKYLSYSLAGYEDDFEMTNARSVFNSKEFEKLFPYGQDCLDPMVPKGAVNYSLIAEKPRPPAGSDSVYFTYNTGKNIVPDTIIKPNPDNGSNNWAVSGAKTKSGSPILCNDPHLNLNLPSLWYEMQISTPSFNTYGVSLPGAPTIIIGFNDSCAFGFTNAMRDVRDYYEIKFKDSTMQEYWFQNEWRHTGFREEVIKVKGKPSITERIPMTVWGPVMYDRNYPNPSQDGKAYACRWKAHDASNELKTFYQFDKSADYSGYFDALTSFECPGQNMLFATKSGDILIRQQGSFPAKWRRQGDFVMPGTDSSYAWMIIPDDNNIFIFNPERNFVSSANQYPYDTTYPYYMGGMYPPYRGIYINRSLTDMNNITVDDMKHLQTDNYNIFAETARPVLLKYLDESSLNETEVRYLDIFKNWNLRNDANETGATIFTAWWNNVRSNCSQKIKRTNLPLPRLQESTLLDAMLQDSLSWFTNNMTAGKKETTREIILNSFRQAVQSLRDGQENPPDMTRLAWGKYKDSNIDHLLKIPVFSSLHLNTGGCPQCINAHTKTHGPSWRMIVELTEETNAYGIYPGGQNGNPGSKYYNNFVNDWCMGKYYKLQIVSKKEIAGSAQLLGKMKFFKT